ncbi:hypothetical protein Tco_1131931 [Tanacetum coccineum]|uniref:Uncharacterized protein n=1 Tax=Tanacetum coccineum TaxID=301880 RepID=A0ABQ5JBW3_9ASTR
MVDSSLHKPSSPKITLKEEPITLDKPKSLNLFLPADQVEFIFEEIAFTTNNEVALLYPSHPNSDYFREEELEETYVSTPLRMLLGIITYLTQVEATDGSSHLVLSVHNWALKPNQTEGPPFTDHMKAICNLDVLVDPKALKPSAQTEETSKSKTGQSKKETQSSSAKDKSLSHPSPPTPVVGEMHKEAQQAAGGPTSLGATSEEGAHRTNEESRADEISKKIKLENLSDLLKDTRSAFFTPDSPQDEPIIKDELEQQKGKAEAKVASLKASCLPTELKELPLKFTELSGEIKELKQHVKDLEIELPGDLKEIPTKLETFTSTISSLTS